MSIDKKYRSVTLISGLVIVMDQLAKYMICRLVPLHSRIEIIQDYFNIIHIRNTGIAFGLLKNFGSEYRMLSLICVSAVALLLIAFLITQVKSGRRLEVLGLSLILGGAAGNLIDRFRLGEVIDFIDVHWRSAYHWPAFNLADSAIAVGITLIVFIEISKLKQADQ